MVFNWLNAEEAKEAGTALADRFPLRQAAPGEALSNFVRQAVHELGSLQLNIYKRARFANAFKWRLLENGVQADVADQVTQTLLMASVVIPDAAVSPPAPAASADAPGKVSLQMLAQQAEAAYRRGEYSLSAEHNRAFLARRPRDAHALNGLGAALVKLGDYPGAQELLRKAVAARSNYPEAQANLGAVYLAQGLFQEAEHSLRKALQLKPSDLESRSNLGLALAYMGRLEDARGEITRVLRAAPRHSGALYALGVIARTEGLFDEAEDLFKRSLVANGKQVGAWAELSGLRKMTRSDSLWLKRAEQTANAPANAREEAGIRFAIGKYYDDVGEYGAAFKNYSRANQVLKTLAAAFDRSARTRFIDDMVRVYTAESITRASAGGSSSTKPIFVVGMMRSGTSLMEQILASHPAVGGAGELDFWNNIVRRYDAQVRADVLGTRLREKLADDYLRTLTSHCPEPRHVVDKAPANSDYLGLIHTVFPQARIILMRRDPIDTCLSCYFQQFPTSLNFTFDLADLAHYYTGHARLAAHWVKILPAGTVLEVPYEELVMDQQQWTRRILEFLGLEWDERCLQFYKTQRTVLTASTWQVRQPIYRESVQRWRHYEKFIGPLRELQ